MVPLTRREALLGAAGVLGALAGCGGESRPPATDDTPDYPPNVARDPAHHSLRSAAAESIVELPDGNGVTAVIAEQSTADAVTFREIEGAAAAREFLTGTDFSQSTVYVERTPVEACYELQFCHVEWSESEVRTSFARTYRDWDVPCEVDDRDLVLWLVRIPDTLDPETVTSHGTAITSGQCRPPRRDRIEARAEGDDEENRREETNRTSETTRTNHAEGSL